MNRATIKGKEKTRRQKVWDVLQASLDQTVETVTRSSRLNILGGQVEDLNPPEDIDEFHRQYVETGVVRANINHFVSEVVEPGVRIEAEDDATEAYFMGGDDAPDSTPEGGFLQNCAVLAGEKHQPFYPFLKVTIAQRWTRGTNLIELLKDDPENPEFIPQGFKHIRPETVSARTYNNTNILVDPEDTDTDGVQLTKRGEAAAYVQFDENSILGRRHGGFDEEEVPLSQNDVLKQVFDPDIGGDSSTEEGIFGTSIIESVTDEITEYNEIKRDRATAIKTKAYGIWDAQFDTEVIELPNNQAEVQEWDSDSQGDWINEVGEIGPGDIIGHDGSVTLNKFEGEVPELGSTLEQLVEDIMTPLPAPKFVVGFGDNINRDITKEQAPAYQRVIDEERQYQEQSWTPKFRLIAERHPDLDPTGLKVKLEPPEENNPIKRLTQEEINKIVSYAEALSILAGPQGGPGTIVDTDVLLKEIAQLPDEMVDNIQEEVPDLGTDEDTMQAFEDILSRDTLASLGEGDRVELPSGGKGVIIMEGGDDVEIDDESVPEGKVVVAYVSKQGYTIVDVGELKETTFDVPDDVNPEDVKDAMAQDAYAELDDPDSKAAIDVLVGTGIGFDSWPDSWEDSSKPARLIALDAWASMGGTWRGCFAEIKSKRICSAFKDEILGTTRWR